MKKIVGFGEIMLRLSTQNHLLLKDATSFEACYGGSESNVLIALTALGNTTDYISVIPDSEIGTAAVNHLKKHGVGTSHIARTGENLGMYFLETGFGERPSKVIYHRKHAAVTQADENSFNYDKIFENCSIFHVCGISLALSEQCRNTVFRFAKEAKKRDILISFDFNYRSKLWTIDEARPFYQAFLPYVDICFGNGFDLKNFLEIDEGSLEASIQAFFRKYNAKYLCFNYRNVISSTVNELTGYIYTSSGNALENAGYGPCKFEILDRVGGGDCFSAGILHVLNGDLNDYQKAVQYGIACDVLKHTLRGDIFTLNESALTDFINKKSKEMQR